MDIKQVLAAIEKNDMTGIYAKSPAEAREIVKGLLNKGATVSSGGSMTLKQTGIYDLITGGDYNYLDRTVDIDATKNTFKADFYLLGCNAITADGVLYNVDGFANRISALTFGPERVIVVAGRNKIVQSLSDAVYRVKTVAAPLNAKRLGCKTYCAEHGKCVSLNKDDSQMYDGCSSPQRICCSYAVTAKQRIKGRITVIIIDEELGL